jgi:pyruvate dehydrogenase E2 component (dihydrolipoamide acetyltransferase)
VAIETIKIPDIGGAESVDVIEVSVKVGDTVNAEDSILVLESDKASMDIPSPITGKVVKLLVRVGDKVAEGSAVMEVETVATADQPAGPASSASTAVPVPAAAPKVEAPSTPAAPTTSSNIELKVPDIGGAEGVDVIEVCVKVGDEIAEGASLLVLESDKASMEIPADVSGKITSLNIKVGDKVSAGHLIGTVQVAGGQAVTAPVAAPPSSVGVSTPASAVATTAQSSEPQLATAEVVTTGDVYAGPAVRKLARQMAVDLAEVKGSGPRSRITKDDVRNFVKSVMQTRSEAGKGTAVGSGIPPIPAVDFAQFGDIELVKMSKIKKLTALNMSRNWLNIPHVTQFDDVDITEMEAFRQSMKAEAEKAGVKLTPFAFLLKACAAALKAEPSFNVSMHSDGEHIVQKKFIHIGMAVDTPLGLMVPVIRDVDKKGLFELAEEAASLAKKAREGKLLPKEMQGGCFTISSLGAIGGTGFTPIVNAPEVGILGVSRSDTKPVWNGKEFVPRLMLPLCLSYDHRAINGSDAGRFLTYLSSLLNDVRRLLL